MRDISALGPPWEQPRGGDQGFKKGLGALHDEIDVGPSVQEQPKGLPGDVTGHTTVEAARGAVAGAAQGRKS